MKRIVWLLALAVLCTAFGGCFGGGEETAKDATTTAHTVTTTGAPTTAGTTGVSYPFTGYINASTLNVRPSPDTNGYPIGGLKFGEAVSVTGREGDWYAITFAGTTGYVNAQYVQDTVPTPTTEGTTLPTTEGTAAETATPTDTVAP